MDDHPHFCVQPVYSRLESHPSCHASTIVALPDDSLLLGFYAGSVEKAHDVAILTARYDAETETWSQPQVTVDVPGRSLGNPLLFWDQENLLWLFYLIMQGDRWHQCTIHTITSTDYGTTWQSSVPFRQGLGWTTRNNLILLSDDSILFPLSDHTGGGRGVSDFR